MKVSKETSDHLSNTMSVQKEIVSQIISKLNKQFDDIFEKGLILKGFSFESRIELENFVAKNCKCEDYQDEKRKVYFVNEVPFLVHYYEPVFEPFKMENYSVTFTSNLGNYKFI